MKQKYIALDDDRKEIKVFRNESDAMSFLGNIQNLRKYGSITIQRKGDGGRETYNESKKTWEIEAGRE